MAVDSPCNMDLPFELWAVIIAAIGLLITIIVWVVKLTRSHTELEVGHKLHVQQTSEKFRAIHKRVDGKADQEIIKSMDAKLDLIITKLI